MKTYKWIIGALVLLNISACFSLYTKRKEIQLLIEKCLEYDFQMNYSIDNRNKLLLFSQLQLRAEDMEINNVTLIGKDDKKIPLYDLLTDTPKLIYYFSTSGCTGCYEPVLLKLDSISKVIGEDKILIVSDIPSKRIFESFIDGKFEHINLYRINEKFNLVKSPDYEFAYAFLLDKRAIAHKVIITDKSNVDFTDAYFASFIEFTKSQ